jgi:methylated-DNA-[protein]-cysteine S-methyltransferase
MIANWQNIPTADGTFTIVTSADAVLAAGWTDDVAGLVALIHPDLRPGQWERLGWPTAIAGAARTAVEAYYDGEFAAPAAIPVLQQASPFRTQIWQALRRIPPGQFRTYAQLAAAAGHPAAVRAAGGACGANAAALFVPCHRVIRTDGAVGGFRYGAAIKGHLLAHEHAFPLGKH